MIVRVFDTAMESDDIEKAKSIFRETAIPQFARFPGCHGIEMQIGIDEHSRDLIDVAAVSRWDSVAAIEAATATPEYEHTVAQLRPFFQQTPLVRHFEVLD